MAASSLFDMIAPKDLEENPKEHTRGWWFPIELVRLFENRTINSAQLILLGKINSLQNSKRGCYASNRWLGDWWGKGGNWVSKNISQLEELGLVEVRLFGKPNRTHREIRVTYQLESLGRRKIQPIVVEKYKRGSQKSVSNYRSSSYNENESASQALPPTDGEKFIRGAAKYLMDFFETARNMTPKSRDKKNWQKQVQWLLYKDLGGDKARLKHVIKAYTSQAHDKFTPRVFSPFEFRHKFAKIEAWTNKHQPPPPKEEYVVEYEEPEIVK